MVKIEGPTVSISKMSVETVDPDVVVTVAGPDLLPAGTTQFT
jgi:hypothetical protein